MYTEQILPQLVKNGKLLANRAQILELLDKSSIGLEIGTLAGDFADEMLQIVKPKELHLIDKFNNDDWPHKKRFTKENHKDFISDRFLSEIEQGKVIIHHGYSDRELPKLSDNYFDWIYIDGDHRYEAVKKDLEQSLLKIKSDGLIILNDFTLNDPWGGQNFGVIPATYEFCNNNKWEIIYFALEHNMCCDVVLRKVNF